jgi:hypothetical protein
MFWPVPIWQFTKPSPTETPTQQSYQQSRTIMKHSAAVIPTILPRHLAKEEIASSERASGAGRNWERYLRIASNLAGKYVDMSTHNCG